MKVFKIRNASMTSLFFDIFKSSPRLFSSEAFRSTHRTRILDQDYPAIDLGNQFQSRSLLEIYRLKWRMDAYRPRRDQMLSSFPFIEKVRKETDMNQVIELYEVLKDSNLNTDNILTISTQVALFYRFSHQQARHVKGHWKNEAVDLNRVQEATESLLKALKWNSSRFEDSQLASAVLAIASHREKVKSHQEHSKVTRAMLRFDEEIRSRDSKEFTNGDIAVIILAYGKANVRALRLFKVLRTEIMARDLVGFTVEDISKILWSYAQMKQISASLFAAIKKELLSRDIRDFSEKVLVSILWSYAMAGGNAKDLFRRFKHEIMRRGLSHFSERQLAQIVSSYAEKNRHAPDLFQGVASDLLSRGELNLDSRGLTMVARSFAKTKNFIPDLFSYIGDQAMNSNVSVHRPWEVVELLWALTEAGFLQEELHHKLKDHILCSDFTRMPDSALLLLVAVLESSHFIAPDLAAATEAELVRRSDAKS